MIKKFIEVTKLIFYTVVASKHVAEGFYDFYKQVKNFELMVDKLRIFGGGGYSIKCKNYTRVPGVVLRLASSFCEQPWNLFMIVYFFTIAFLYLTRDQFLTVVLMKSRMVHSSRCKKILNNPCL